MKLQKYYYPDQEGGSPEEKTKKKVKIEGLDIDIDPDILKDEEDESPETEPVEKGEPETAGELPSEFVEQYKNKSSAELLKILHDSQKQIGKLGNELGEKRKREKGAESYKKEREDTQKSIEELKTKMDEFDKEYDSDDPEYKKLERETKRKESKIKELLDKEQEANVQSMVQRQMSEAHNKDFLVKQRSELTENLGLDKFENEAWDAIAEYAEEIAGIGNKLTEEDVQAAAIKVFGAKNYAKLTSTMAQIKVREQIAKATGKAVTTISGASQGSVKLENLPPDKIEKMLDNLFQTDYPAYLKLTEKIREKGIH